MVDPITTIRKREGGGNWATPHVRVNGTVQTIEPENVDNLGGAGAINASAADLSRWLLLQLGRGMPPRVGVLARLVPVKGIELAIDSVVRCPGLELEIVGDGPERPFLERRVSALPGDVAGRIEFVGFDPEPLPRVARWRALLVTSHHEGNPISVLEALALGTPVISGNLRGVADILGGPEDRRGSGLRGGWSLPDRNPQTWAAVLEGIAKAEPQARQASQAARERFLSAFTAEVPAQKLRALYAAAVGALRAESLEATQQPATRNR